MSKNQNGNFSAPPRTFIATFVILFRLIHKKWMYRRMQRSLDSISRNDGRISPLENANFDSENMASASINRPTPTSIPSDVSETKLASMACLLLGSAALHDFAEANKLMTALTVEFATLSTLSTSFESPLILSKTRTSETTRALEMISRINMGPTSTSMRGVFPHHQHESNLSADGSHTSTRAVKKTYCDTGSSTSFSIHCLELFKPILGMAFAAMKAAAKTPETCLIIANIIVRCSMTSP
mmetsp:Transcript_12507/g.29842  ORF Transcript_12507/g.29842 Transcript_12507/m.29842 type:complete len:241 (-) Transcript_12507:628-1350(-)